MKACYQRGSLELRKRAKGPAVYYYRWRDSATGSYRGKRLGNTKELPTEGQAWKAADAFRRTLEVNTGIKQRTFGELIEQYELTEMPKRFSTSRAYKSNIKNHVKPKWENRPIAEIEALEVRYWIEALPLGAKSKSHVRSLMFLLFETAMLHKFIPYQRNPIELVRVKGGTKRQKAPRVLNEVEIANLFSAFDYQPLSTMIFCALCFGLRCSELFALKWSDFNWERLELQLERAIVMGRVDKLKTEESSKPMPIAAELADQILAWKSQSKFSKDTDWVFASHYQGGELPVCGRGILELHLKPKAKAVGLGLIGWHTFRHTYRSMLSKSGATIDVQRGLMRHSSIQTTMNVYGGAVADDKREAHGKVVRMVFKKKA